MAKFKQLAWRLLSFVGYYGRLSRFVPDSSNAILMYHSVGKPERYGNVSAERLRDDIRYIKERYELVDLPAVLETDSPEKRVALTFDDGWDDFYENAVPVLEECNAPATVFVVSKYLDSEVMMSTAQVRELITDCEEVTIGNHTQSHPKLSRIGNKAELKRQIWGAKADLEDEFGVEIDRFCYPSGDFDDTAVDTVRDSHSLAVSTRPRVLAPNRLDLGEEAIDRYTLPRIAAHNSKARVRWELSDLGSEMRTMAKSSGLASR